MPIDFIEEEAPSAIDFVPEEPAPKELGPAWPAQEGETIAEPDPERQRKREELANQMRLRRAERSLSDAIESFLGGAARAVEPLTPAGLMNQPTRIAGAIAGKTIPDIYQAGQPLVNVPQPSGTGFLAGLGQLGAQTLSGLTTPEMVVTASAFPVSGVARALTAGEMAATLPESISRGGEVLRSPEATVAEKVVAAGQPLVTAAMVKALTKAERILPQAAEAAKEATKGEISDAIQERSAEAIPVGEAPGDRGEVGTRIPEPEKPAETQAETVQASGAPSGQAGLLLTELTPEQKLAEQRALDEALGQETIPRLAPVEQSASLEAAAIQDWLEKYPAQGGKIPARKPYSTTREESFAKAFNDATISNRAMGQQDSSLVPRQEDARHAIETGLRLGYAPADISAYLLKNYVRKFSAEAFNDLVNVGKKSTPPPESTPTVSQAAEPSLQTPAQQGSISEPTTPQQITQAPFLDIAPEKWTHEYWKRIGDEGRRTVRSNLQGALQKLGSKTKVTERSTPQAVFNAIGEVNKARTEPPPTMQLRFAPKLGLTEFIKQDVVPFVKKGVDASKAAGKLFVDIFSPASHAAKEDVNVLFEGKGFKEKVETRIVSAFEDMKKQFDSMPQPEQIAFVDRVKTGQPQPTPELQRTADLIRKWDDTLYSLVKKYKPDVPYLDNHMRVLWQKVPNQPTAIGTQKAGIRGKRPFQGSKGFLKQHVLADMSEGIRLGGIPVSYNPIELFTLHAQDVMKFVAANRAWEGLKKTGAVEFVRRGHKAPPGFVRFDDPIARTYFRVPQGLVTPGEYYVQEGAARMLHNYLSRDWIRTGPAAPIGKALLGLKNFTTNIELGMSPFHAFFESNEVVGSSIGLGLRKLSSGQYVAGLKDIAEALPATVPIVGPMIPKTAAFETASLGGKLIKYAKDPAEFAAQDPAGFKWLTQHYPATQQLVNDLFTAGGQVGMHQDYRYALRRGFKQAVESDNYVGAVVRALPALNELMQKPLFETYIPRLKVGMWLREYSQALTDRAGDIASGKTTRPQLARETWSFIEDRFGELNWDNLYWNRTLKSAMQLAFRSVTWKLGNLRGFGKAGRDIGAEVIWRAIGKGQTPRMTYPMMWLAGMSVITAIQSSIISKVATGKYPWELVDQAGTEIKKGIDLLKNLVFPRIDAKDPTQRVSIPTYWRDAVHIAKSAKGLGWDYIRSSMTGEINRFAESLNNKDFYGHPIYNPLDPIHKRALDFMAHLVPTPFGISSYKRATESGASTPQALMGVAGYTKAPASVEPAPTSQVYDLAESWMAKQGGKTAETARRRAVQEQRHAEEPSIYQPLKIALKANRIEDAGKEYDKLMALRRPGQSGSDRHAEILRAMRPFTLGKKDAGTDFQPKHQKPFTGSLANERKFVASLTPEQRRVYDAAIAARQEIYARFLALMKTR